MENTQQYFLYVAKLNVFVFCLMCIILIAFQLEDSRAAIKFELENMHMVPDPEPILLELIHAVSLCIYCVMLVNVLVCMEGSTANYVR